MTEIDATLSTTEGPISTPMIAALEDAWTAIRTRHHEVPAVMIVLGAGSAGAHAGMLKLGHFAALRWTGMTEVDEQSKPLAEVFVGGEGLACGPVEVLGTLLHEAGHALADVRGIKDTSRQGRWHNAKFKALAEELGIEVTKDQRIGWSPTTTTDATRDAYADVIDQLGHALRLRRAVELGAGEGTKKKPGLPACVCGCGRRIRVALSVLELGPIHCGTCEQEFLPESTDTSTEGQRTSVADRTHVR